MTPLVSVIIPSRNRRRLLSRTLAGVLAQEGLGPRDLEVVVVNDASDDDTASWLDSLADERVCPIHNSTAHGVAGARNVGLAAVRGKWVAFTDDDDVWAPTKLASQLDALRADSEARWSCVGTVVVDENLEITRAEVPPDVRHVAQMALEWNCIPGGASGVMATTELVRRIGGFDESLSNLADWDLWVRLALASPLASVRRPLLGYWRHRGSLSHSMAGTERELRHVAAKYVAEREQFGVELGWVRWLRWMAEMNQRAGKHRATAKMYVEVARDHGDTTSYIRAAYAGAFPGVIAARDWRARRRMPVGWDDEADEWLAWFRELGPDPLPRRLERRAACC